VLRTTAIGTALVLLPTIADSVEHLEGVASLPFAHHARGVILLVLAATIVHRAAENEQALAKKSAEAVFRAAWKDRQRMPNRLISIRIELLLLRRRVGNVEGVRSAWHRWLFCLVGTYAYVQNAIRISEHALFALLSRTRIQPLRSFSLSNKKQQ
jgi:hypothetical protein